MALYGATVPAGSQAVFGSVSSGISRPGAAMGASIGGPGVSRGPVPAAPKPAPTPAAPMSMPSMAPLSMSTINNYYWNQQQAEPAAPKAAEPVAAAPAPPPEPEDKETTQSMAAPDALRQGVGQRIPPSLNALFQGKVY